MPSGTLCSPNCSTEISTAANTTAIAPSTDMAARAGGWTRHSQATGTSTKGRATFKTSSGAACGFAVAVSYFCVPRYRGYTLVKST